MNLSHPHHHHHLSTNQKFKMILSLDLSSNCGYSIFQNEELVSWGVVKAPRIGELRTAENTFRRSINFSGDLRRLLDEFRVFHLVVELPHGSQDFHSANVFGFTAGVVGGLVSERNLSYTIISEGDNKKHNLHKSRGVGKKDMINRVAKFYPALEKEPFRKANHIADSVGAYFAAFDLNKNMCISDSLELFGRLRRQG